MLVLSRRRGESFLVGTEIVVTVVAVGGNTVRLGITAPGSCQIVRSELLAKIAADSETGAPASVRAFDPES
jgi:carbon storage regulator